jgi:hypothetical protein
MQRRFRNLWNEKFCTIVSVMVPDPAKSASFFPDPDLYPFQINVKTILYFFPENFSILFILFKILRIMTSITPMTLTRKIKTM